jgi:hypothetical protein
VAPSSKGLGDCGGVKIPYTPDADLDLPIIHTRLQAGSKSGGETALLREHHRGVVMQVKKLNERRIVSNTVY